MFSSCTLTCCRSLLITYLVCCLRGKQTSSRRHKPYDLQLTEKREGEREQWGGGSCLVVLSRKVGGGECQQDIKVMPPIMIGTIYHTWNFLSVGIVGEVVLAPVTVRNIMYASIYLTRTDSRAQHHLNFDLKHLQNECLGVCTSLWETTGSSPFRLPPLMPGSLNGDSASACCQLGYPYGIISPC